MLRRLAGCVSWAAVLLLCLWAARAHSDVPSAGQWTEGVHYFQVSPPQPTGLPAGKIQVLEIFSYACPGCSRFYPVIDRLAAPVE